MRSRPARIAECLCRDLVWQVRGLLTCTWAQSSLSFPSFMRPNIASSRCSGRLVQSEGGCSTACVTFSTWLSPGEGAAPNRGEILCFFQPSMNLKKLRRCTFTATGAMSRSRSFSDCTSAASAQASMEGKRYYRGSVNDLIFGSIT